MRSIPDPGFAGDDGAVAPEVAAALAAYDVEPGSRDRASAVLDALRTSRLLVPVLAVADEVEYDDQGLAREKTSDMAAVLMRGRDGRTALLAFTASDSLRSWNSEARPVPVAAGQAALAAVQEGAAALLVDVAGPVKFVVQGEDLAALAGP